MFEVIFLISVSGYFLLLVLLNIGQQRKFPKLAEEELPTVSVIVAARNEKDNILRCLQSLDALVYPENKLEILIVDDHSTDGTGEIIDSFISGKTRFRKVTTSKEIGSLKGKTNALATALEVATGKVIMTTDADCSVSPSWVKTLASYYTEDVGMVDGFTSQETKDQFSGMQNLDFLFLLSVASGTINFKLPLSCIGNNMSYRKDVYDEVGGYQNLEFSVTEDFSLMFAIDNLKKYKIIYPFDAGAHIVSLPCENWRTLFLQKKRWGVGGLNSPLRGYIVMANAFLTHLCIVLSFFFFSQEVLMIVFSKLLVDFFLLYYTTSRLGLQKDLKYFPVFQIYYTLYVILLPFIVLTNKKVIWKGREY